MLGGQQHCAKPEPIVVTAPPAELPRLREIAIEHLGEIEQELKIAALNRQVYVAVRDEIVNRFPHSDGTFLNSYSGVYARS